MDNDTCKVEGCDRLIKIKRLGLCGAHYHRQVRYGNPEGRTLNHGNAHLTADMARQILSRYNATKHLPQRHPDRVKLRTLAEEFGVAISTISIMVRGQTWKHLD